MLNTFLGDGSRFESFECLTQVTHSKYEMINFACDQSPVSYKIMKNVLVLNQLSVPDANILQDILLFDHAEGDDPGLFLGVVALQ